MKATDHRLLVPVVIEALVVKEKKTIPPTTWTEQTPDYGQLVNDRLGMRIVPSPFEGKDNLHPPGVHLHWALPDALTHGAQGQATAVATVDNGVVTAVKIVRGGSGYAKPPKVTLTGGGGLGAAATAEVQGDTVISIRITEGGKGYTTPPSVDIEAGQVIEYPPVPNRWVVLRMRCDPQSGEVSIKAWVVESDYLDAQNGANPWIVMKQAPAGYHLTRLGRCDDYTSWAERNNEMFLTAVGPGNPFFAASYPGCRNVFGLHDDMQGVAVGRYTYMVAGWFSDPSKDPLYGVSQQDWPSRMQTLRWCVPKDTDVCPQQILCHGLVHGVDWRGCDAQYQSGVPSTQAEVAVGTTAFDALATLINARMSGIQERDVDRLLGVFQYGLLKNYPLDVTERDPADCFVAVKDGVHQKAFYGKPGGSLWEIQKKETQETTAEGNQTGPSKSFPATISDLLGRLNQTQRNHDAQQRELAHLQWELYANWFKAKYLEGIRIPDKINIRGKIAQAIQNLKGQIRSKQSALQLLRDESRADSIPKIIQQIGQDLESTKEFKNYTLTEKAMPSFWRAFDPTVLLYGIQPSAKHGEKAQPEIVSSRVSGQTVTGLRGDVAGEGFTKISVEAGHIKKYYSLPQPREAAPIGKEIEALLIEAMFLDPNCAMLIARAAYAINGIEKPTPGQSEKVTKSIADIQTNRARENFAGILPEKRAVSSWRQAWTPLFMAWEANWYPYCYYRSSGSTSDAEKQLTQWRFSENNVDYAWQEHASKPDTDPQKTTVTYRGYAPLSPHVSESLEERHRMFSGLGVLDVIGDVKLLSQCLSGLTDAIIMREHTLRFPPLKKSLEIDEEIVALVGDQWHVAPMPDSPGQDLSTFSPIRAGHLLIKRLWVVDAFGQVMKVIDVPDRQPPIHISKSLAPPGEWEQKLIHLPPRLAQPARLLFRWRSAADDEQESSISPESQPICGWILPNRLENSLVVYDGDGKAVGAVQLIDDPGGWRGKAIRWSALSAGAPGHGTGSPTFSRPTSEDIRNPHLLKFVHGLLGLGDEGGRARDNSFVDLLGLIDMIGQYVGSRGRQQNLSILIGRPLALVRASLQLELDGPPAVDQSWPQSGKFNSQGFTRVEFRVRLGDFRKGPDGLVGYFVGDTYDKIRLTFGVPQVPQPNAYFEYKSEIRLTCDPRAKPVAATLLMDPRVGVHVSSGILPTKFVELPAQSVSRALSAMDVTFLVAPVLGRTSEPPGLPLPGDVQGDWVWISRARDASLKEEQTASGKAKTPSLFNSIQIHEGWLKLTSALKEDSDGPKPKE